MSRPRTPTKVLRLRGAFERNPQREKEREREPELPLGLGPAPECLDEAQAARWNEIRKLGKAWLTAADRLAAEAVARAWAQIRSGGDVDLSKFMAALGKLGFTPTDRSKVQTLKQPEKNAKARFFA